MVCGIIICITFAQLNNQVAMKNSLILLFILCFWMGSLSAQHLSTSKGYSSLGLGLGLPYGGLGMKLGYNTADHVTLFGGLGYNMVGIGANGGVQLSIPNKAPTEFYFTGMYGYNTAMIITDRSAAGRTFAGPSLGTGLKINSVITKGNFWDVGLLVPIRSQNYKNAIQEMTLKSKPWPVLFYFGYNYNISSDKKK